MSRRLFDSSALLDLATNGAQRAWSEAWFADTLTAGRVGINPVIYAELAPSFVTEAELDRWFAPAFFERLLLPYSVGWLAAQAFVRYRRAGGMKTAPMPDFFIGAHAAVEGWELVTRDPARVRTYFPQVRVIAPPALPPTKPAT